MVRRFVAFVCGNLARFGVGNVCPEILPNFEGTVLLVSHDRDFMDHVVTSLIVLDGRRGVSEHVGGFSDWEAQGGSLSEPPPGDGSRPPAPQAAPGSAG